MKGYQFDIDGRQAVSGNNYEEKGRLFLALRGQVTRVVGGRAPMLVSTFGDGAELAKQITDDWNAVHIIVRGNTLMHILNGQPHVRRDRRRRAEPPGGRHDRRAGARRAADEGRVSQYSDQELVSRG